MYYRISVSSRSLSSIRPCRCWCNVGEMLMQRNNIVPTPGAESACLLKSDSGNAVRWLKARLKLLQSSNRSTVRFVRQTALNHHRPCLTTTIVD